MSTIAEKLEYLDGTREKILTETNRLGVGLTEQDKFRDYAKGLHDGYVDVLNNGIDTLYDNMEKVSGSGSDITLENTEEAPMKSDLEGDTYQETTTGKNLLDISDITSGYGITNNNNESITLQGGVTSTSFPLTKPFTLKANTTYTLSITNTNSSYSSSTFILRNGNTNIFLINYNVSSVHYTPTEDKVIDTLRIFNGNNVFDNFTFSVQLEKGSTASEYEKYSGGVPSPNPDYPQPINVVSGRQEVSIVGKNLLGLLPNQSVEVNGVTISTTEEGYLKLNGTATAQINKSYNWLVKSSTYTSQQYTLSTKYVSGTVSNSFAVNARSGSTPTDISSQFNTSSLYINAGDRSTTFTPSGSGYITGIQIMSSSGYVFNNFIVKMQIEKGNQPTTYEAYKGQSYEINLGKNLLNTLIDKSAGYTSEKNGITQLYNDNGSITLSGIATAQTDLYITNAAYGSTTNNFILDNNTAYTLSLVGNTNNNIQILMGYGSSAYNTSTTKTITPNSNISWAFIRIANGTDLTTPLTIYPQLEKGSQASSFSPYKTPIDLCEINDYEDMIFRGKGVNLLDISNGTDTNETSIIDNNEIKLSSTGTWSFRKYEINVIPNQEYTISTSYKQNNGTIKVALLDSLGNIGSTNSTTSASGDITYTFTTRTNQVEVRLYSNFTSTSTTSSVVYGNIQLNEGSTALPYEPYNSKGKWLFHKEIGKVVFNGSENWTFNYNSSMFRTTINNMKRRTSTPSGFVISNYFKNRNYNDMYNSITDYGIEVSDSNSDYLYIRNANISTANDFKTWLSTHNTIVYYVLATPTTTEITDSELISQLEEFYNAKSNKDVTYISVTSEDLPAILNVIAIKKYE